GFLKPGTTPAWGRAGGAPTPRKPVFPHFPRALARVLSCQRPSKERGPSFGEGGPGLEEATRLKPRLPLAHKKLGQALAELGRGTEADEAFEEFFEQDSAKGEVALALDHLRSGRRAEAIETLRSALRNAPDNVDAMRVLAQTYFKEKEHLSDAEALLRRATELAPSFTAAWMVLGGVLHEANRHRESIEVINRVLALEPRNAAAWAALGNAYSYAVDVEKSREAYERSL